MRSTRVICPIRTFDASTPTLGLVLPVAVPLPLGLHVVAAGLVGLAGVARLRRARNQKWFNQPRSMRSCEGRASPRGLKGEMFS